LLILTGITTSLNYDLYHYLRGEKSLVSYLFFSIVVGGIFGWVLFYFWAYAVALIGVFFKSKTSGENIVNIIAYSYAPLFALLIIVIFELIFYSIIGFPQSANSLVLGFALIKLIIQLYCLILMIIGVSKVQGLSILKGVITILIPCIVVFVIGYGLMMIYK
jgi:hypothetical protein